MENVIIVVILLVIVGAAAGYVIRAKKRGQKCIGCPDSCHCGKNDHSSCGGCGGGSCGCNHG